MMPKPLIFIATPCFGGMVSQTYLLSVVRLMNYARTTKFDLTLSVLGYDAMISRARSTLVATFLDNPAATHLLFIDADIGFEPQQVGRLLNFDKEFTGALYPLKLIDWEFISKSSIEDGENLRGAALTYVGSFCPDAERKHDGDFATGTYVGGGFQMIRRSAIEKMIAAYPHTRFRRAQTLPKSGSRDETQSPSLFALFDPIIDPKTGDYLSEDYSFCLRWRQIGGEIWIDAASKLTHTGLYDFVGDYAALLHRK